MPQTAVRTHHMSVRRWLAVVVGLAFRAWAVAVDRRVNPHALRRALAL